MNTTKHLVRKRQNKVIKKKTSKDRSKYKISNILILQLQKVKNAEYKIKISQVRTAGRGV